MNVLAERSLSHVQGLELCGQGHPPITRATGESSIQGTWGKEWSCWGKYQSLGSIVLAFTLAKEAIFCLRKFKKIELISLGTCHQHGLQAVPWPQLQGHATAVGTSHTRLELKVSTTTSHFRTPLLLFNNAVHFYKVRVFENICLHSISQ